MKAKYDSIGIDYNLTRKADKFISKRLLHHLNPNKQGIYLDIGCGTGNYTNELQKKGFQCIGIDPSQEMLDKARAKNGSINWRIGTAEHTRLPKHSTDGIMGSLTIHHWTNLDTAFLELKHILKPGGRLVLFTSTPEQMKGYWLNHYFPKMLEDSIAQMPTLEHVKNAMSGAQIEITGTEKYAIREDLQDQFLYCGKHHPELYFDEQIRQGISSFSALANSVEVQHGLQHLREDIDSGAFNEISKNYENQLGDYLYIMGKNTMD